MKKKITGIWLLCLIALIMGASAVSAASNPKYTWVEKNQYYYFYNKEGRMYKNGIFQIRGKRYYFDSSGKQRTGWRKAGNYYYFFQDSNGQDGCLLRSRTIDGIKVNKYGRAVLSTARAKRKLSIMLKVLTYTDQIVRPGMTQSEKRKICFEYVKNHFRDLSIPDLGHTGSDWDMKYAEYMLSKGCGNCYCFAAVFAYFANAIGDHNVLVVNDSGHGWTEIGGLFYDPEWAQVIGSDKCYAVPASLSGKNGRPNWAAYRTYIINIDR